MLKSFLFLSLFMSIFISGIGIANNSSCQSRPTLTDSICSALDYQLSTYPASQYRDIYKNFMQDFFGPGHILSDTVAAANYLRHELTETSKFDGPLFEPTGYMGNFYRVNLSLIRDSIIPYQLFFDTFIESVKGINPPADSIWMEKWNKIDSIIKARNIHFENEMEDREVLNQQFLEKNFIVHHSKKYNQTINFHYRIISRKLFESTLLPLIKSKL